MTRQHPGASARGLRDRRRTPPVVALHAPYLDAREHGESADEATAVADRYTNEVKGVVPR